MPLLSIPPGAGRSKKAANGRPRRRQRIQIVRLNLRLETQNDASHHSLLLRAVPPDGGLILSLPGEKERVMERRPNLQQALQADDALVEGYFNCFSVACKQAVSKADGEERARAWQSFDVVASARKSDRPESDARRQSPLARASKNSPSLAQTVP